MSRVMWRKRVQPLRSLTGGDQGDSAGDWSGGRAGRYIAEECDAGEQKNSCLQEEIGLYWCESWNEAHGGAVKRC